MDRQVEAARRDQADSSAESVAGVRPGPATAKAGGCDLDPPRVPGLTRLEDAPCPLRSLLSPSRGGKGAHARARARVHTHAHAHTHTRAHTLPWELCLVSLLFFSLLGHETRKFVCF